MAAINPLNVYSGPDALRKYFDPEFQPPLPLVEIPKTLNPFYDDGVRIYGKMMSMHPANNVKIMPGTVNLYPDNLEHFVLICDSNEHVGEGGQPKEDPDSC